MTFQLVTGDESSCFLENIETDPDVRDSVGDPVNSGNDVDDETQGIFELISRVGNRRLLYDPEHPQHLDRGRVSNAWLEIATNLKVGKEAVSADWCRKKWKKIRDYYMRLKREGIKRSGQGRGQKITWIFYTAIHSILRTCAAENEKTISNLEDVGTTIQSIGETSADQQEHTESVPENSNSGATQVQTISETPKSSQSKRKRRNSDTSSTEKLIQLLKETGKEEDGEYHFSMNVAERLRQLSPRSNRKAQAAIQTVLFEIEFPEND